jgi:hypothetical protein
MPFDGRSEQLATLSTRRAVPTIYERREFAVAGSPLTAKALSITVPLPLLGRADEVIGLLIEHL